MAAPEAVHLFIDYQNVHLTGHELFGIQGAAPHLSLIHPARMADQIDASRVAHGRPGSITKVYVFRGLPSATHEPGPNGRNQAQASEWCRDPRVVMQQRPLRYPPNWPADKAREKGIDVMLATSFVRAAILREADVLILASRDTDLAPALELAQSVQNAPLIEECVWGPSGRLLCQPPYRPWCTFLGMGDFDASLDKRTY